MVFSSLTFLFCFLPALLLLYYLSIKSIRNYLLLLFSIIFYAWGGVSYSAVLLGSILVNFLIVRQIQKSSKPNWLRLGMGFNIALLAVFKYANFFIENINAVFSSLAGPDDLLTEVNISLPIGISFFTFQQMSMLWDVYRKEFSGKIRLDETALYVSAFPQLIAGPIVKYHDIIDQIKDRTSSWELFRSGVIRFILGLFKKVVFANTCGAIADEIMGYPAAEIGFMTSWVGIICYALQIYFDFSGYSDMAIGLGRMFGFRILENFNFPYISRSIREFWQRWHISLSTWFRDYVYIPLGGNQKGIRRTYLNLILVFALTGLWHGSTWSFVIWGLFHGLFIVLERLGGDKILKRLPTFVSWGYTMLVVLVGWVFFRIEQIGDALSYLGQMFSPFSEGVLPASTLFTPANAVIVGLALLSTTTFLERLHQGLMSRQEKALSGFTFWVELAQSIILMGMLYYCILLLNANSFNPFIYFRF